MYLKKLLTKSLLVMGFLTAGAGVTWAEATYTTTYNKALTADLEQGISAWDAESDISSIEWVLNNAESNMALSVNETKGLLFSIGKGNTGSNYATKTFSAVPEDGIVQYEVSWRTVRQYGKNGSGNKEYSYIQFGDKFRLSTGFNYYGDQPLYVNYDGQSSTDTQVMSKITSGANHNIVVKINCKNKKILMLTIDGTDYTPNITTTLTGSVFNTLTIGSNKATSNSWDIEMCSLISAKVSYSENGVSTWNFLDTSVWGNYTSSGKSSNYKESGTGEEVWFTPNGSAATSETSNVSFKYASDASRFNYGGTRGLGFNKSYDSTNDINYTKVSIPANYRVIVDVQTGSTGRPIVFNLEGTVVGTYKNSGTYSYTNEGESTATLLVYGTAVKNDYSTNTIRSITLINYDNLDTNNYIVNAVDEEGNVLKKLSSGEALPYNTYNTTGIPYVISYEGAYYELSDADASNHTKTFTMGEEYAVNIVSYAQNDDIVFFQEYEHLSANGGRINSSASSTGSNGYGAFIGYTSVTSITNATSNPISTTGVYDIMVRACDRSGKTQTKTLYLTDGTTDTNIGTLSSSGKSSSWYTTTLSNVPINSGQYFKLLTNTASSNDTYTGDYILVKKSKTNITISDAGWATLYTPNALDFSSLSEDVTAYTATCTDGVVTLTAVDDVPANTGVVLKGAAATYSIPVIASSETEKGDLTGSATATAFNAYDGYTLYMLKKVGDNAQFVPVTSGSVAAGKAFLKIANAGEARSLSVVFADETTGISTVNGEGFKANGSHYFDLQGRRVVNPASGLYIVSGKKVIVK